LLCLTHRTAWPCAGPYQGGSATTPQPRVNTHPGAPWHDLVRRRAFWSVSARPPPLGELRTDSRRAVQLV